MLRKIFRLSHQENQCPSFHIWSVRNTLELGNITERFLLIWKIFGELSDLQEKAKKEGILKNDVEEDAKIINDENFAVGNYLAWLISHQSKEICYYTLAKSNVAISRNEDSSVDFDVSCERFADVNVIMHYVGYEKHKVLYSGTWLGREPTNWIASVIICFARSSLCTSLYVCPSPTVNWWRLDVEPDGNGARQIVWLA